MKKELINLRKRNEKHFLNEDGTIEAFIYNEDIHCLKNGVYEEINNTLVENNQRYSNKLNNLDVSFSKYADENLVLISKDKHYIKMNMVGNNKVLNKELKKDNKIRKKGSISYLNVFENVDLNYQILSNQIKENIIIHDKSAIQDKIVFHLVTNLNLKLENNKITSNSDLYIDKSFMVDSSNIKNENVYYELNKKQNFYELILHLDKDWLLSEDRTFPIYIDPTIMIENNNGVQDVYITDRYPDVSRNYETLRVGGHTPYMSEYEVCRSLIKFDLPIIETGSTVIDAKLILTGYFMSLPTTGLLPSPIVEVHQITQQWNESTATWNNMHDKYNPLIENYGRYSYSYEPRDGEFEAIPNTFNITNLVKKWYAGTPNYGVLLKLPDESVEPESYPMYYSSNVTDVEGIQPYIVITYRNQNGLESYLTYEEQALSQGTIYVGHATGNMTAAFALGNTKGGPMPTSLSLFYNTNDVILNHDYGFGKGMKSDFNQTLKKVSILNEELFEYVDEDGTIHYFIQQTDENGNELSRYIDEDDSTLTLQYSQTVCTIMDKDMNRMIFTKMGDLYYLTSIIDSENHTSTIEYSNNRLSKITDASGSVISIQYTNSTITVTSPVITTTLTLSNNKVIKIENMIGTTSITYNDQDIINTIQDATGIKYGFEYYNTNPYRIKKIQQYGTDNSLGKSLEFTYAFQSTAVKDNKGKKVLYTFNSINNTISESIVDETGDIGKAYGKMYDYGMQSYYKNKLFSHTDLIKSIQNLFWNSSFEKNDITFSSDDLTVLYSNEKHHTGQRSLKLQQSGTATYSLEIEKPGYYTLSFYSISNEYFTVELIPENGTSGVKTVYYSDEFERNQVTAYLSEPGFLKINIILPEPGETVFIDDMQLEEGKVANPYNLVDNGDFRFGLAGWYYNNSVQEKGSNFQPTIINGEADEIVSLPNGQKAFKFVCAPNQERSISLSIPQSGNAGDIYYVSFWYKNEGVVCNEYEWDLKANHFYASIIPTDSDHGEGAMFNTPMNPNDTEWQFYSTYIGEDYDYNEIIVSFLSLNACNYLYVTNMTIIKDFVSEGYNYDKNGNVTACYNKNRSETDFIYDGSNQLIQMTTPMGGKLQLEYDNTVRNRILGGVSRTGITNQIKYDSFGNPIVTKIHANTQTKLETGKYYIRKKGTNEYFKTDPVSKNIYTIGDTCSHESWKIIITDETLKLKPVYYNHVYILDSVLDELNLSFESQDNGSFLLKYNDKYLTLSSSGLLFKEEEDLDNQQFYFERMNDDLYIENSAKYTEDGKYLVETTDSLFNKMTYDVDENKGLINSITDALGNVTQYTYNNKNQLIKIETGNMSGSYVYDNNLLSKIIYGNKEFNFEYDNFLNVKTVKLGTIPFVQKIYEERNGNLLKNIYGNNHEIQYEYDEFDRVKKLINMDETYIFYYDNFGNLKKEYSNNIDSFYEYDFAHRLISYERGNFSLKCTYNDADNITLRKEKLNFANVHTYKYEYNIEDIVTKITNEDTNILFEYDSLGRVIEKNVNGIITKYGYATNGNRTSNLIDTIEQNDNIFKYKYDKSGNITRILKNGTTICRYYYDIHNQLVKEENENGSIVYTYDDVGNILNKKTYNTLNTLINSDIYSYNNSAWQDQLTKYNNINITYDAIGNPITIGNANLTWINGRQLSRYENTDENLIITYKYNKDGIRTEKNVNGIVTKYYVEGNKIIYRQTNDNVLYFIYDCSTVVGFQYDNDVYYYIKNVKNDIVGICNSNLETIATYEYDSWGKIVSIKDANGNTITNSNHIAYINPLRYRGYYYDDETGLYYLNSRYYNPTWGRFINADGIIGANNNLIGYNLYVYVSNNPVNYSDWDGEGVLTAILIGMTIGVAVNVASQAVSDVLTSVMTGKPTISSWQDYAGAAVEGSIAGAFTAIGVNPILSTLVTSSVSSVYTNSLKNLTTNESKSMSKIGYEAVFDTILGVATSCAIDVPGITTGSNSYKTVYKSGLTKLRNDTVKTMSDKVIKKAFKTEFTSNLFSTGVTGIKNYVINSVEDNKQCPVSYSWAK